MIFRELDLPGVYSIELTPFTDERGTFRRTFCREEMQRHGIDPHVEQCSQSDNLLAGTLRGLHFQRPPHAEGKLVRCISGSLFDVVVDLRPESPTLRRWTAVELKQDGNLELWIPPGCAHGFLTLADNTSVLYQMTTAYAPQAGAGYRWDDPAFSIEWPAKPRLISPKDLALPLYDGAPASGSGGCR
jgi:dTDP-4-dehydrorhamnose 3,5-epimerase